MSEEKWTNIQFDSQILSGFMACPREMNWRYNEHLVPIGGVSKGIEKGSLVHRGMKVFYDGMKENIDYSIRKLLAEDEIKKSSVTFNSLTGEDTLEVLNSFHEYCEYRKNDVFQVVFTEQLFKFIAYEQFPLRIILTGRIDLGIIESGSATIIPIDHKTESEHWFHTTTSNQFKIYALACDSNELIVNRFGFQKTLKAEKKFKRERLPFDEDVLDEFKYEILPYYAKQMLIAREDNFYPPNYKNCIHGHFGCIFSDKYSGGICNQPRGIREEKLKRYFKVEEWNPEDEF